MSEEQERSYRGLTIIRGKRHCKIINEANDVVFRTTNVRDAEHYLDLIEENDRLLKLLEARGVAPHRIYLLATDENMRGRVNLEGVPASEVVIVAKADDALVVRHLSDGREEIVDNEELEPIEGGSYLQGPEVTEESVHVVVRYDRDKETAAISTLRTTDTLDDLVSAWTTGDAPGSEYGVELVQSEGDILVYSGEASIED